MPRLTPVSYRVLECVTQLAGWKLDRHKGTSHKLYIKDGEPRPVPIPTYSEIDVDLLRKIIKQLGLSRTQYLKFLAKCK